MVLFGGLPKVSSLVSSVVIQRSNCSLFLNEPFVNSEQVLMHYSLS